MKAIGELLKEFKCEIWNRRFILFEITKEPKYKKMLEYITKHSDSKMDAVKRVGVKFQGYYFRPCVGLNYWIRWGRYCIDLRPLCSYLKIECIRISARTQAEFEKELEPLKKKLPCDLFLMTIQDAIHAYEKPLREEFKVPNESLLREEPEPYNLTDELPF